MALFEPLTTAPAWQVHAKPSLLEPMVLGQSPVSDRAPPDWTDCWPGRFGLSPWFLARRWQPKDGRNEVQVPLEEEERGRTGSQMRCIRCIQSIYLLIRLNKYDVSSVAPELTLPSICIKLEWLSFGKNTEPPNPEAGGCVLTGATTCHMHSLPLSRQARHDAQVWSLLNSLVSL